MYVIIIFIFHIYINSVRKGCSNKEYIFLLYISYISNIIYVVHYIFFKFD